MKITAWAYSKWTGKRWEVANTQPLPMSNSDGSVEVRFKTNELTLSGHFNMSLTLSADEVANLYRLSQSGPSDARIRALEAQIKKLVSPSTK